MVNGININTYTYPIIALANINSLSQGQPVTDVNGNTYTYQNIDIYTYHIPLIMSHKRQIPPYTIALFPGIVPYILSHQLRQLSFLS